MSNDDLIEIRQMHCCQRVY